MKHRNSFATINDFMHAVVISCALAVTALVVSDELLNLRGDDVVALAASAVVGASLAYAAMLAQPAHSAVQAALMCRRSDLVTTSL